MNKSEDEKTLVFISYASEDRLLADAVQLRLQGSGYRVFFDTKDLPVGGNYHVRLRDAVAQADLFVFLVSAASISPRRYTLTELKYARQRWAHPQGKVLPVVVQPVAMQAVPGYLKAVTMLEPEGDVAAEIADAVASLVRHPSLTLRPARRAEARKPDPAPFLRYLDREMAVMGGLIVVSLVLLLAGVAIHSAYPQVWWATRVHGLAGVATAVFASVCFYRQLSHLLWIYGQIQLAQSRRDTTTEDLEQWLSATDGRDAWVSYRSGLVAIGASLAAYGYATIATAFPGLPTVMRWSLGLPLAVIVVATGVNWYVSKQFPHADNPVSEWLQALIPLWLHRRFPGGRLDPSRR